jgi:hypothetical protein
MRRLLLAVALLLVSVTVLLISTSMFQLPLAPASHLPAPEAAEATRVINLPVVINHPTSTRVPPTSTPTRGPATPTPTSVRPPAATLTPSPARTPTLPTQPPGQGTKITRLDTGLLSFSDVQTHQVVRTSTDRVYIFAPEIYKNLVRAIRATTTGTPAGFAEVDAANRPNESNPVWCVDAAIDANNVVHVLYLLENGTVVYRTFDTNTDRWGARQQIASSPWPNRANGLRQGSAGVTIGLDGSGIVHIVYNKTQGSVRRVYYNSNRGGSWNNEALVDDQPTNDNSHPAMAFGPDGSLYVAWLADQSNAVNRAAIRVRALRNGVWASGSEVDNNVFRTESYSIDQGPSLLVAPDGKVHIAYIDPWEPVAGAGYQYGRLNHKFSTDRGANWTADNPPELFTHNPALAVDPAGNLYLFGHREAWQQAGCASMLVITKPSGGGWNTWRTLANGCYDSSVSVKWSQYVWNNPSVLDLVYWTEKGPQGQSDYNQLHYAEIRGGPAAINSLPGRP